MLAIVVPTIHEWDSKHGILTMEFCRGENLEVALMRNGGRRSFYVALICDLLAWMRKTSFGWKDFAPRNILFSEADSTISLVDFESPLKIGRQPMSLRRHSIYCQESVILELSALLFAREQRRACPCVWQYCKRGRIRIDRIDGRRKRMFVRSLHPGETSIAHEDLARVQRRISSLSTPFLYSGSTFYPLHALSRITEVGLYVDTVLRLQRQSKGRWPDIIENSRLVDGTRR